MSNQEELPAEEREVPPPDYVVPGIRCALEMILVGMSIALLGLPAPTDLQLGIVLIASFAAMVVVLFWCLNRHMAEWIRRAKGKPTLTDGSEFGPL